MFPVVTQFFDAARTLLYATKEKSSTSLMRYPISIRIEVLLSAKQGNKEAFTEIMEQYERPIYNFVYSMIQHTDDAADITQDIFIKLYTHIEKLDTSKNFNAWVFTIARKTVYDFLRKKRRKKESPLEFIDVKTPEQRMVIAAYHDHVDLRRGLTIIHPRYREILLFFYWYGYPYTTIADILHIPLNTVKTRLRRARHALSTVMREPAHH